MLVNGTEPHKGNNASRAAYAVLQESGLNFIGNMEGRDILKGDYDVMVCDGMNGNVAIKTVEGTMSVLMKLIKQELTAQGGKAYDIRIVKLACEAIDDQIRLEKERSILGQSVF